MLDTCRHKTWVVKQIYLGFCLPNSCIGRLDWAWLIDGIKFNPYTPYGILQQLGLVFNQPTKQTRFIKNVKVPFVHFWNTMYPTAMHPENSLSKAYGSCRLIKSIGVLHKRGSAQSTELFWKAFEFSQPKRSNETNHLTEGKLWHQKSCFPIW